VVLHEREGAPEFREKFFGLGGVVPPAFSLTMRRV
jgi:hypothetical protein